MVQSTQISGITFDAMTRRYEGDVEYSGADGTARRVRIAVVGHLAWPFERVQRELMFAARIQRPI